MNPEEYKEKREKLGLTLHGIAKFMRMGKHGGRNVHRWETGDSPLPGWAALIMEIISSGKLPDLSLFKRTKNKHDHNI
ncbi:DNA methyltransferase [uncultured Mediterranean phage uvDeep-CGR0-AD1-C123]|nr:DNA methyltransferase [uncultured Mediterranean phage uvDeep-CGR0-AD1-C123]